MTSLDFEPNRLVAARQMERHQYRGECAERGNPGAKGI
jgi:hypothetical protein